MSTQNILIILTIIHISNTEIPKLICLPPKPFQTDINCGDFNDVCVKKNDSQCNNFQAACKQCPPTNYTVSMLLHLNGQLNHSHLNQNDIKNQINISNSQINVSLNKIIKKSIDQVGIGVVSLIFILINFIFDIFIFLKVYFEDKCCKKKRRSEESLNESQCLIGNQHIIHPDERFQTIITENERFQTIITENERFQTIITEKIQLLEKRDSQKEYSSMESVVSYKLRFRISNQFDETELFVSKFDNVIKLKKSICDRNINMNDYKRMIMKYKGVTLDNNQYLLSSIDSTNIPIFCEFDNNIDVNAMIVIKLKCDNIYPEILQISKHQQIKDLKMIISRLNKTNYEDLLIFYKSNKLDDDDKTIDDYKIEENDWIQVVNKSEEMLNISMKSIFTDKETISIEFSKFETVSDIINKSIQKIQHKMATNHFAVFLNKKLLENDKFIYEYNIDSKSLVEFCYFKKLNEIKEIDKINYFAHTYFHQTKNSFDIPVLLKPYTRKYMDITHDKDLSKILKKDLHMFQITKSHPRFMQLVGIYMDNDWIYIEIENLRKGSMKNLLSRNIEIPPYEISKWAYQILEGLKHLHNHNIIMKDMNPTDICIDGNHDVKLTSFNMTDYLTHLFDKEYEHRYGIVRYIAPEILEGKPYEASVDVWSLGVIMIEVVTRDEIFPKSNENEIFQIITDKNLHTIEYDITKKSPELVNFIDCCVIKDPKERATIDQLMKHKFIEKYL